MINYTQLMYRPNWFDLDCYSTTVLSADDLDAKRDAAWNYIHGWLIKHIEPKESIQLEVGISADPDIPLKYHLFADARVYSALKVEPEAIPTGTVGLAAVGVPRNPPPAPPGPPIIDSMNLLPVPRILLSSRKSTFSDERGMTIISSLVNAIKIK